MLQFSYDQDAFTLKGKLYMSSALVVEARFIGHGINQVLAGRDEFFWPGLAHVGIRSLGGILF